MFGSVRINAIPDFGSSWWYERMNQQVLVNADGTRYVYDAGPNIIRGVISLSQVDETEGRNLIVWLRDTALFGRVAFAINIATLPNTDIGGGFGTSLLTCFWDGGPSTEGYFELKPPGRYDIKFPYWYKV